jgi:hypothetical protein
VRDNNTTSWYELGGRAHDQQKVLLGCQTQV